MTILDEYTIQIENFISDSIRKFINENSQLASIGIYCCPWAGWLTTNFNVSKTAEETGYNCPDFEFTGFDLLELEKWQEEYETELPTFKISEAIIKHNHDLGDEKFNAIFFPFLKAIVINIKKAHHKEILLQILDSNYNEVV